MVSVSTLIIWVNWGLYCLSDSLSNCGLLLHFRSFPYMVFYQVVNYLFYLVRPLCLAFLSSKVFFLL